MTLANLPDNVRTIAETELTAKQREAWLLWEDGLGYGKIAQKLGLSTSGARNRVHAAVRNIELALERQTPAHPIREQNASRLAPAA